MGFIAYFQKKKFNLKGHCQALFIACIYFLIPIVCKALLRAGKCNSAPLHLADNEFCFLSGMLSRDRGRVSRAPTGLGEAGWVSLRRARGALDTLQGLPAARQSDASTGSWCAGFHCVRVAHSFPVVFKSSFFQWC